MNGNFKTLITIAATPLLLLSCSDEVKLATESEGENLVSLTVQLPEELGTRAFGEASKIKSLKYAVYPQGEQQPLAMFDGKAAETVEMTGLSKNVQLQLASGKKYDVIFWAAADEVDAQSKFDETTQVATLAPTVCSNEADDAFFAKAEIDVNGNLQQTVKLYRPYAQLNIGTDDLAAAAASGYTVTKTQVATQAYSAINLASGSVVGNATDVTFSYADIPDASEAFPAGSAYNYLSMNYVLVPDYKTIADVTLDYTNGTTPMKRTFTSVPLQRNYRTNIYGSLLTNSVDFNVVIEPAFIGTLGIATDEELADAASHHNRHVQLADNVQLALPTNIAEGVVITGGTNSVLKIKNGYQIPNDNVTFKDITLARDDSAGTSDGYYLNINSDNVVLDNVKLGIINLIEDVSYAWGCIYLNGGKTLTVRNTNFTIRAAYGVFAMDPGTTIILENCNFGPKFQYCTNQPGNGKLIARNTTFRGWMSGWSDGYFENCTFDYGDLFYPSARCYGSSVFKDCEFGRHSTATDDRWLPTAPDRKDAEGNAIYDYDYAVSCMKQHSIIEFINCRYSDGSAFNKNVFLKGKTDSSVDPDKVIINGTTYTDINEFTYW